MLTNEGFPAQKVYVIPNGVDTNRFAQTLDEPNLRAEIGVGPTDPVVSIVAALRPEKNHELFLDVARRALAQFPNAKFLIIGEGPRREPLEQVAAEMGITASVRFLGNRSDIARLLTASDVFLLTSHNEANPVSILEAMSVGKPVVATDVGSIHEAVAEGRTGYLVPPGDATALSDRLVELLENPLRAQEMGAAARESVVENWSVEAMVRRYERLIASIYCRKRPHDAADTFDDQARADDPIADDYVDEEWQDSSVPAEA
jgi:glycosyltransferase involved in cell wall biosynthesis